MVLTGPLTAGAVSNPWLRGRIVLVPVDYSRPLPPDFGDRVDQLAARAAAVVLLSNRDSATRARRLAASLEPRLTPDFRDDSLGAPVVELFDESAAPVLAAGGARSGAPPGRRRTQARENPRLELELTLARRVLERGDPPNLVAALDGSDPELAGEYVAISAHLDHIGMRAGPGDSIYNGADDNASGVAGLLELAEAFAGGESDVPARASALASVRGAVGRGEGPLGQRLLHPPSDRPARPDRGGSEHGPDRAQLVRLGHRGRPRAVHARAPRWRRPSRPTPSSG